MNERSSGETMLVPDLEELVMVIGKGCYEVRTSYGVPEQRISGTLGGIVASPIVLPPLRTRTNGSNRYDTCS